MNNPAFFNTLSTQQNALTEFKLQEFANKAKQATVKFSEWFTSLKLLGGNIIFCNTDNIDYNGTKLIKIAKSKLLSGAKDGAQTSSLQFSGAFVSAFEFYDNDTKAALLQSDGYKSAYLNFDSSLTMPTSAANLTSLTNFRGNIGETPKGLTVTNGNFYISDWNKQKVFQGSWTGNLNTITKTKEYSFPEQGAHQICILPGGADWLCPVWPSAKLYHLRMSTPYDIATSSVVGTLDLKSDFNHLSSVQYDNDFLYVGGSVISGSTWDSKLVIYKRS